MGVGFEVFLRVPPLHTDREAVRVEPFVDFKNPSHVARLC
jgi:hypothetical protein